MCFVFLKQNKFVFEFKNKARFASKFENKLCFKKFHMICFSIQKQIYICFVFDWKTKQIKNVQLQSNIVSIDMISAQIFLYLNYIMCRIVNYLNKLCKCIAPHVWKR